MRESSGAPKLTIGSACDATDPQPSRATDNDFEFAFNSSNFSDRVLRIEVMAEPPDAGSSRRECRRDDGTKEKALESAKCSSELASNCEPKTYDCEGYENHNEDDESAPHELTPSALQVEEAAFMELLRFMYSKKLSITPPNLLLDVLMAADKFEVVSCMQYCSELLRSLPVTTESALLYLDLPYSTSLAFAVQPLIDVAKDFLANSYKDIAKFQDEMMNLPLAGIEVILSSDDLQAASEDAIYDFVLKWARTQYTAVGERRDILSSRLLHHIRFAHLSCSKLRKILMCDDLDHDLASKLVTEALFFKSEAPYRQRALAANELNHRRFVERAYKYRPLTVVEFDRPHPQCIVYLDLKREECAKLFPSWKLYSHPFHLGGQNFYLLAHCNLDQQSSFHCFGLFLGMHEKGSISRTVDYMFAARTKQLAGEFVTKYGGRYTLTGRTAVGFRNLIQMNWSAFIAEDSPYFIDGTLHLRAEVTIRPPQPPPQQ